MRVISKWALHFSGNRELNIFTGLCFFWRLAISISFFLHSFNQSLKYLLSTYYTAGTILGSEDIAVNKEYKSYQ